MIPYILLAVFHCTLFCNGTYAMELIRLKPMVDSIRLFFPEREVLSSGCDNVFANAFHLNMFVPYNGVFIHAWSVGVQYHFYLWLPPLFLQLRLWQPRRLVAFTAAAVVISAAGRFLGQLHHSQFAKGSMFGAALDLFWYGHSFLRGHTIIVGLLAAYISKKTTIPQQLSAGTWRNLLLHVTIYALIGAYLVLLFNHEAWYGDHRYVRSLYSSLFSIFGSIGGVVSTLLWSYVVLACVHRWGIFGNLSNDGTVTQEEAAAAAAAAAADDAGSAKRAKAAAVAGTQTFGGLGLSALLATRPLAWVANLSYMAYLLHPTIYAFFFSQPLLLYPPSAVDTAPLSLVSCDRGGADSATGCKYGPSPALKPFVAWWLELRQSLLPAGQELGYHGTLAYCGIMVVVVYIASAVLMYCGEVPVVALIKRCVPKAALERAVYYYSVVVIVVGLIGHIVGTAVIAVWLKPELEYQLKANAPGAYLFPNATQPPVVNATTA